MEATRTRRWAMGLLVLAIAGAATAFKIKWAASTFGTNDTRYWGQFADGVRQFGPVDIYGQKFLQVYNHPPLATDFLVAINWLVDRGGPPLSTLIKLPAIIGDLIAAMLVFDLVRRYRPLWVATAAGLSVALSPVLWVISGFHGNTDPFFVALALAATWFLATRTSATAAGLLIAAAVSVKLIPVVLVPVLAVAAWRWGGRRLVAFLVSSAALMALVWLPTVRGNWDGLRTGVLGYAGNGARDWGVVRLVDSLNAPEGLTTFLLGPGRWLVLLVSAAVPAVIVWRRPERLAAAVGLGLVLFLALSPAFAMQYLAWTVAAAYLVTFWGATLYNAAASVFVLVVYVGWNAGAAPWDWDEAKATPMSGREAVLAVIAWLGLLLTAGLGLAERVRGRSTAEPPPTPDPPTEPTDHEGHTEPNDHEPHPEPTDHEPHEPLERQGA